MSDTRVLLVRHGQSTWNAEGRWQGWADPPLSELGEQQAAEAASFIADHQPAVVVTSDLARARRTGEIIASAIGIGAVIVEPDLRERSVGDFEGHTGPENQARFPEAWDGGRVVQIPGGESDEAVLARVIPALLRIAHRHPGEVVLVVSHGGVTRILEHHLGVHRDFSLPNLGGRWFEVCEGGRIEAGDVVVGVEPAHVTRPPEE